MDRSVEALRAEGRSFRSVSPRSIWADWVPSATRDPLARLEEQNRSRLDELVPLRRARMAASPFGFFRGAAAVMADDLAGGPWSGISVQSCGDAHLLNFGLFASPERALVFDLNDFDETAVAPFECDVARLAASMVVAARARGFGSRDARRASLAAVASYRTRMNGYATASALSVWHERVGAETAAATMRSVKADLVERRLSKSRARTSASLMGKLTSKTGVDGVVRIVDQPPLIAHIDTDRYRDDLLALYDGYLDSLPSERAALVRQFRVVDVARKVVGVGSVGTVCFIVLLLDRTGEPLFLQVKQAQPSVLAAHSPVRSEHDGIRVVTGQRLLQAVSDPFLGWSQAAGRHFYVRQLSDMKGSADTTNLNAVGLAEYGAVCGWLLARAHARCGVAPLISGYLGSSDTFDKAMSVFACRYADVNDTDHADLKAAIAEGCLDAVSEESSARTKS